MGCYVESRKSSPGAVNLNPKKVIIASQNMLLFGLSGTAQGMQLTELVVLTTFFLQVYSIQTREGGTAAQSGML